MWLRQKYGWSPGQWVKCVFYFSWVIFLNISQFQPDLWLFHLVLTCHGFLYIHHFIQRPAFTQQLIYTLLFSTICKVHILNFDLSKPSSTINNNWSLKISAALLLFWLVPCSSLKYFKIIYAKLWKCQKSNWLWTAHRPFPCADH